MDVFRRHEELFTYLLVGLLTTAASWISCFFAERFWLDAADPIQNFWINTIGWAVGVGAAYPMNRSWVFKSRNPRIVREFLAFAASRLSTWILDAVVMWLTVNILTWDYWVSKICISAVFVTVLNYVFSKVLIFQK